MGCNNHPGSCQVPNSPHCSTTAWVPLRHPTAPIIPHHRVQQPPWILSGTQLHPSSHITGCNNRPGSCQAPNRPPSPHTTGCNNLPGSCQVTNTPPPPCPTTAWDPIRHPTAPVTPHHGAQQWSWILSGTQQPPSSHTTGCNNRPGPCQAPNSTHHATPWNATTIPDPVRHPTAPIIPHHGMQQPSWVL